MIASDERDGTMELTEPVVSIFTGFSETQVPEEQDNVINVDDTIPVRYKSSVHFIDGTKRSPTILDDVSVVEMEV